MIVLFDSNICYLEAYFRPKASNAKLFTFQSRASSLTDSNLLLRKSSPFFFQSCLTKHHEKRIEKVEKKHPGTVQWQLLASWIFLGYADITREYIRWILSAPVLTNSEDLESQWFLDFLVPAGKTLIIIDWYFANLKRSVDYPDIRHPSFYL